MLVITANTLRQQLTNTEGTAGGCHLPKWLLIQKNKRQLFVFTSISTILLLLLKVLVMVVEYKETNVFKCVFEYWLFHHVCLFLFFSSQVGEKCKGGVG